MYVYLRSLFYIQTWQYECFEQGIVIDVTEYFERVFTVQIIEQILNTEQLIKDHDA